MSINVTNLGFKQAQMDPLPKPVRLGFPTFFNPRKRTPIMTEIANRMRLQAPAALSDINVFGVIHLEDNALAFVNSLLQLGLDPMRATFFAKGDGYRYANKSAVIATLRRWGISVETTERITAESLDRIAQKAVATGARFLFVEDGPFFGPLLLGTPSLWAQVAGYLQQTTRGMPPFRDFGGEIGFPVVSLPESELKRLKEPPYVGKTFLRGLSTLFPHREWTNQKIAIFGSGPIGRAVGDAASALCMRVAYTDTSARAQVLADNLCGELATPIDAVRGAAVIAGFTGGNGGPSITADVLAAAEHGTIIASGSSEQFEIDLTYLKATGTARPYYIDGVKRSAKSRVGTVYTIGPRSKELILVNDGWPMSFIGLPGTTLPDQLADFVMSLMLVAAVELSAGRFGGVKGIVTGAIDKLADEYEIPAAYLRYWRT